MGAPQLIPFCSPNTTNPIVKNYVLELLGGPVAGWVARLPLGLPGRFDGHQSDRLIAWQVVSPSRGGIECELCQLPDAKRSARSPFEAVWMQRLGRGRLAGSF